MAAKAIGVFDSGVGGLTVLRELFEHVPGHSTIYLGDTARVPYGTRSADVVVKYALNNALTLLEAHDLSALVVACNTASAVAIDALQDALPIPVVGVIEPGAEAAFESAQEGSILVMGTAGTVKSEAYIRALRRLGFTRQVQQQACPLLVPLVEEGWTEGDVPEKVLMRYLHAIDHSTSTVIMGCTHYPLLQKSIQKVLDALGSEAQIVNGAVSCAKKVRSLLGAGNNSSPQRRYLVTDAPEQLATLAPRFLGQSQFNDDVELVNVVMKHV